MPGPGGPAGARSGAFARLNLTDEQRAQTRDILLKSRDEAAPLIDQLQLARKDLRREIFADKRDSGKLRDLSARIESLKKQVSDIRLKARTSLAGLLTPEQRLQMRVRPTRPGGVGPRGRRVGPPPVVS
jgi:Spy/CpxP family protein refolding chaperone